MFSVLKIHLKSAKQIGALSFRCLTNEIAPAHEYALQNHESQRNMISIKIIPTELTTENETIIRKAREEFSHKFVANKDIQELIILFQQQVRANACVDGIGILIEAILQNNISNWEACRQQIDSLYKISLQVFYPSDFLAFFIISLISLGHFEDAKFFTKSFSIPGRCFISPLNLLASKRDLTLIEEFSELVQKLYFDSLRQKSRPCLAVLDQDDASITENENLSKLKYSFLIGIWKRYLQGSASNKKAFENKKKSPKIPIYVVDMKQLFALTDELLRLWISEIESCLDYNSLLKLCEFVERNRLKLKKETLLCCLRVFAQLGRDPPPFLPNTC